MADGRRADPYACLPPALVISLEEGPRRDQFRVACGQHLSNGYEIIDAIDTRHLGNGHIGCALSHRRAIEIAVERDWDEVLVLEDDAFPALARSGALSVLSRVPRDAELVYLGGFRFRDYRREATEIDGLVRLRGGVTTTHALIYRRCVYTAVLDYIPPSVESVEESWGRGDPMRYGFAIDREYARWQADPERAIYAVDPQWAFIGNWSHAEPAASPQKIRIYRDAGLAPTKMLVSRYHRFMTALLPGNASEELLRAVALAEARAALRLGRGASVREAMGNRADPEWWLEPREAHRPRYADYCKFLVWQDPLERLRRLYLSLAAETEGDPRWPGMVGDGLLRPPLLDEYFEPLVEAELALRASAVIDERVRPQDRTFRNVPVDVIVPLARLNDFLAERFGFQLPLAELETSRPSLRTPRPNTLSSEMEATLARLVDRHYESDFAMLNAGVPVYGGPVERRRPGSPGAALSDASESAGRLPDFMVIGAQKSGTTSLFEYIVQHPAVARPKKKEMHFFDRQFDKGESWYRECFASGEDGAGTVTGEATPVYLFHPLCAERIHALVPDARMVVILRNPVTRAVSHYWHSRRLGQENESFADALSMEEARVGEAFRRWQDGSPQELAAARFSYRRRGEYVDQLNRYFELFGKQAVLVLCFEEFVRDPIGGMSEVYEHLGVDRGFEPTDTRARGVGGYADADAPAALLEELQAYYRPFNERLFEAIDRRFDWEL